MDDLIVKQSETFYQGLFALKAGKLVNARRLLTESSKYVQELLANTTTDDIYERKELLDREKEINKLIEASKTKTRQELTEIILKEYRPGSKLYKQILGDTNEPMNVFSRLSCGSAADIYSSIRDGKLTEAKWHLLATIEMLRDITQKISDKELKKVYSKMSHAFDGWKKFLESKEAHTNLDNENLESNNHTGFLIFNRECGGAAVFYGLKKCMKDGKKAYNQGNFDEARRQSSRAHTVCEIALHIPGLRGEYRQAQKQIEEFMEKKLSISVEEYRNRKRFKQVDGSKRKQQEMLNVEIL